MNYDYRKPSSGSIGVVMISFEDFRLADGNIDWRALQQAEVKAGERCYRCYAMIRPLTKSTGERLCYDCKQLDEAKTEEVEHQRLIRCPKCSHLSDVTEWDCDYAEVFTDGEHDVQCDECQHEFDISTRVEFYFTSPKLDGGG